jgi:dipeptidase D
MEPKDLFKYEHSHEMYKQLCALCTNDGTKAYWKWFLALSEIPRRSGQRDKPSEWLVSIAKKMGLECKRDKEKNVCIYAPASKGCEDMPHICVQGHMDMVGTVAAGVTHDWEKDPIYTNLKDGILTAQGTTLGGDDGTGVAAVLCLLEMRDTFKHPAFEMLITCDEEIGCLGASALVPGELLTEKVKYLINVDSEDWGEITISSAGTAMRCGKVPVKYIEAKQGLTKINVKIEKFQGGHSGVDIKLQRANAFKWIVDLFIHAKPLLRKSNNEYNIVSFEAGHAHNAIPSHANVSIAVKNEIADEVIAEIKKLHKCFVDIYFGAEELESTIEVTKEPLKEGTKILDYTSTCNCLQLVEKLPHGVVRYSPDVEGLVETSQSVSIGKLNGDTFDITIFARSSKDEDMLALVEADKVLFKCHGAEFIKVVEDAQGWPADPNSHILNVFKEQFKKLFKSEVKTTAIHAGLENSIIMAIYKKNNLESVSLGPSVIDVHTAREYVVVDTATKLYELLLEVIQNL